MSTYLCVQNQNSNGEVFGVGASLTFDTLVSSGTTLDQFPIVLHSLTNTTIVEPTIENKVASFEFLTEGDYHFEWQVFDGGSIPFPTVVALRTSEHGDFISDIYMPGQVVNGSIVLTVMAGEIISLVNISKKVLSMPTNMPPVYMSLVIHSL